MLNCLLFLTAVSHFYSLYIGVFYSLGSCLFFSESCLLHTHLTVDWKYCHSSSGQNQPSLHTGCWHKRHLWLSGLIVTFTMLSPNWADKTCKGRKSMLQKLLFIFLHSAPKNVCVYRDSKDKEGRRKHTWRSPQDRETHKRKQRPGKQSSKKYPMRFLQYTGVKALKCR